MFKPGYLYRCVWKRDPDYYYINYITEQSDSNTISGRCVATNDTNYIADVLCHDDTVKWGIASIAEKAISITELGHINDFPEYLI